MWKVLGGMVAVLGMLSPALDVAAQKEKPVVVVAELFTSEGCSTCPPADDLLTDLVSRQPIPGVTVLALGEHVDYWDHLGWRDQFSSAAFTKRQSDYNARVFHESGIYTPQLVIDGQRQCIGSESRAVRDALTTSARLPKAGVIVGAALETRSDVRVEVHIELPPQLTIRQDADVLVGVTQDRLATNVGRGENGGRRLRHTAVVRSLGIVGAMTPQDRTLVTSSLVPLAADWKVGDLRVVSFVQERASRRILGAGSTLIKN